MHSKHDVGTSFHKILQQLLILSFLYIWQDFIHLLLHIFELLSHTIAFCYLY